MSENPAVPPHLETVDPVQWPGVAAVPGGRAMGLRSRLAEAKFAKACAQAELELSPDADPDLVVDHAELFDRLAAGGWIGLAESYMAGEWHPATPDGLEKVLRGLIAAGYNPRTATVKAPPSATGGEIPPELVARYAGDGMSAFAGHFATGVPTTERVSVKSFAPGAGRGREPSNYFVSVTNFSAPLETGKLDLGDAQSRSVSMLLDAACVRAGTHTLELPASGGALEIAAAKRRAAIDTVVTDPSAVQPLREQLTLSGVNDAVHVSVAEDLGQTLSRRRARYDAVVSIEHLELLPVNQRARHLRLIDGLLADGGRAALQSVIATEQMTPAAESAIETLRAYIWPSLRYQRADEIRAAADKHTGLRVVAQTHAPDHLQLSLKHQRTTFQGQLREAAADGFDIVYRRLWQWQLALREALAHLGMIDVAQFTLAHRHRRGVR